MDFKRLLHISGLGSWSWNPQSPLRQLDEHAAKICGFADGEEMAVEWESIVHPQDLPLWREKINQCLKGDSEFAAHTYRVQSGNGDFIWIRDKCYAFSHQGGCTLHGTLQNVTAERERKQQYHRLDELRNLLMEFSSHFINVSIDQVDKAIGKSLERLGHFVEVDRVYVFSYDFDAWTTTNTHEWCAPGISPQKDELQNLDLNRIPDWVKTHQKGRLMYVPKVADLPDGGLKEVLEPQEIKSVLSLPMMDDGVCVGFVGFDAVREERSFGENERDLLKLYTDLLVNLKRRIYAECSLVSAKQRAMESDRLKSAFLANISHEIRTPMNGILYFTTLLRDEELSRTAQLEYTGYILESSTRMLNTLHDLIDVSLLESGSVHLDLSRINLREMVLEVLSAHKAFADRKALELRWQFEEVNDQAFITTDAGMLRKVIDKLVHNALKFTTKGKVEVHCAFANSGFQIQIIDTGEGIATDLQEVIFSPFRKGDISASRAKEGSGLGLAVTKGFLKNMGGSIHLQSEVGRGSTFTVWLPVVPPASVALQ